MASLPSAVDGFAPVAARPADPAMWQRWIAPVLLLALPLLAFAAFFHLETLRIDNAGWLIRASDNGENALGAHAYWHDRAAGVSLKTHLLNAPDGIPVLFTDSNPLLTLLVKPFAGLLPADAQFVGPLILCNFVLQALFAWLLLRRHAPGPLALWAGVVLLAFPPTLMNRFIHVNLMAHWTILAALYLFLDPVRRDRLGWWAALVAVTALIHSYLLVMVGAIWASTILVRVTEGSGRSRLVTMAQAAAMLVLVGLLAIWLGVGDQIAARNFGQYSMPLDALWNPGLDHFSTLLPGHEPTPGRYFEGFQYMGAGALILVIAAIVIARRVPEAPRQRAVRERLRQLAPALIVLAILAVTRMHLPPFLQVALDPVRASGRLFWPIGYVLMIVLLLTVYRLPARRSGLLLAGLLLIQLLDLTGMARAVRAQSQDAASGPMYVRTQDPRWQPLIAGSRSVAFIPGDVTHDLGLFQEVAWRAINAGHPVSNVYAARTSGETLHRLRLERDAFDSGALVPGRLYVIQSPVPLPAKADHRAIALDGVTVLAPIAHR
ncbi:DUF6311 domain-containing protein [Sphingomonas sp. S6]|jgi:hypothetical protein|uniref:DUF6311 domain-containing protein n=1 Tax=Sphingomonas sp. S6 TaxID=3368600 RepID=UPI000FB8D3F9|nr:DUF6311 domain-containing protein [uncultured Sphingomonas sp.]RTL22385.1 MAG: hypothetical protein EKK50_01915 [Sphingomonadaceae bacterium]